MTYKNILVSAYGCSPFDISEANNAFYWLLILIKKYSIKLLTTNENKKDIEQYFNNSLPKNLEIISFKDEYPLKSVHQVNRGVKLGYFLFNYNIRKYLKANISIIEDADILFHKTPSAIRYYSCLCEFKKTFIIGPYGGGLKPPQNLKDYFNKEHLLFKLRFLDKFILNLKPYKRQFENTKKILITLPYLTEILPQQFEEKYINIFDVGIDTDEFKLKNKVKASSPINLLFVGRLTRYKGVELAIKAISKLNDDDKGRIILNIVGDGEEMKRLKKITHNNGLDQIICFHGNKNKIDVMSFYENADIFCFPTLKESMGIVLLEAMSYELPIITINYGGPKYICPDNGAVKIEIDNQDNIINNISNSISYLVNNPEERKKMGKINREFCINNYDWKVIERRIFETFDSIK